MAIIFIIQQGLIIFTLIMNDNCISKDDNNNDTHKNHNEETINGDNDDKHHNVAKKKKKMSMCSLYLMSIINYFYLSYFVFSSYLNDTKSLKPLKKKKIYIYIYNIYHVVQFSFVFYLIPNQKIYFFITICLKKRERYCSSAITPYYRHSLTFPEKKNEKWLCIIYLEICPRNGVS